MAKAVPQTALIGLLPPIDIGAMADEVGKLIITTSDGASHASQTQPIAQAIGKLLGNKVKTATAEDSKRVIKLSDAIKIVASNVNTLTESADLSKWITPFPLKGTEGDLASTIIEQMRLKALQQNNPERFKTGPHRTRK